MFAKELLRFVYPAECLHCEEEVDTPNQVLCRACLAQIEWVNTSCMCCKAPIEEGEQCQRCQKRPIYLRGHTSFFTPQGPILALHKAFCRSGRAETLAALLVVGFSCLTFPIPDVVTPYLRPRSEGFFLKKQPGVLLARGLAKALNCPFAMPSLRLEGKSVLWVSDWLTSTESIYESKQHLKQYFPKALYSLALIDAR